MKKVKEKTNAPKLALNPFLYSGAVVTGYKNCCISVVVTAPSEFINASVSARTCASRPHITFAHDITIGESGPSSPAKRYATILSPRGTDQMTRMMVPKRRQACGETCRLDQKFKGKEWRVETDEEADDDAHAVAGGVDVGGCEQHDDYVPAGYGGGDIVDLV